ncbi:ATP-binding protein [Maridesulfovibrio salexigens]|uniref:histidine kinase n=1 Tax=Maridesulfovibrio salexigens (strain ATCC 14822 / DSM 2638 / NCIMB 8403 / VKM B-1763) TaxID=526222 RepID=C6BZ17_MARSD|nr:ATP-binding protein [Maridesulfovibrio salexigens]ACS78841.1 PAS/PAC sensor hybrid histidine kinase [Maridesulfovibrio salexigens DSM 2638]
MIDRSKEQLVKELKQKNERIAELESQLCGTDNYLEERFRRLIDHVEMVSVQGYNKNREVVFWNKASEKLYGYSQEEALGMKLEELIIPDYMREAVINHIQDWHDKGIRIPAGELDLIHKDGSIVPVYSAHVMQKNPDGSKYMYCIDVDLTETKKAHRQLIQAKEQAESASRAKSEFLANMSHEIRTPLNGVLGMLQLLKSAPEKEKQLEYIELAVTGVKRLTTLLSDILDLSRVEAGKLAVDPAPFDLLELMQNLTDLYRPSAQQKGLKLNLSLHPTTITKLTGDSSRLQQVLTNIISNAIKFTNDGIIKVETYPLPHTTAGTTKILFSVSDTGPGIPDSKMEELFSPFIQLSEGYQRTHQGAGLGLSICKQLVELMGGNISIESELGIGTTVYLCIPFGLPASDKIAPVLADKTKTSNSKLKVLLVEDEAINRMAAKRQMELAGCEVTAVENGKLAVEAAAKDRFHIVMMDIQMPIMDGISATQAIRMGEAGPENKNIPIIAMTAYAMKGDREKFLNSGMNDYLAKPIENKNLLKMLEKYR